MPPYENRPGWGKTGERMNFTDRCAIAAACLPKADYRTKLEALHAEMLAAIAQADHAALVDAPCRCGAGRLLDCIAESCEKVQARADMKEHP